MESEVELDTRTLVQKQNKKNKKSGGFQSMGLSYAVFSGIMKKGYKIPTPIQRKCIPIIMEGKDVVAMARTGSGKTAAFLIPMFERLHVRSAQSGCRALILSPTRELAVQTLKFTKELGRFTKLKSTVILGGSKIEEQFAAVHENPDIIIATPGRFLHVTMEMDLKLTSVEYVVFDEADRLFEMGFAVQLNEILHRLPENKQVLLFSATLPGVLADFAKAGLNDPTLIRLDVDSKLSENLKNAFFSCCSEHKVAVLLYILRNLIQPNMRTVVFAATKHHVEYLHMILTKAGITSVPLYSTLDHSARKINVSKFHEHKISVMVVTDLAARGIDIPVLDNVINFSFPAKPKLFVHRVGRVARAGRSGTAYSIVSPDEAPYVIDLHLFLGRPMKYADSNTTEWDGLYGTVPQYVLDDEEESLQMWHKESVDLTNMRKVCSNAHKQYIKSRPVPSAESVKRMKDDLNLRKIGINPLFCTEDNKSEINRINILDQIRGYRPHNTIFEVNATAKNNATAIMRKKRQYHNNAIVSHQQKLQEKAEQLHSTSTQTLMDIEEVPDVESSFSSVIKSKRQKSEFVFKPKKKKKTENQENSDYFVKYRPENHFSEIGLGLEKSFNKDVSENVLDLTGDDEKMLKHQANALKWDRKKKKFVTKTSKETVKKIKTESGAWVPITYKTDIYKKWKQQSKVDNLESEEEEDGDDENKSRRNRMTRKFPQNRPNQQLKSKGPRKELKTKDEILKQRRRKGKIKFHQKRRQLEKSHKKTTKKGKRR